MSTDENKALACRELEEMEVRETSPLPRGLGDRT
jgi:hypothetical protein